MAAQVNEFDPRRALGALMYLARATTNDLYILMKMLYVADKKHLAITGRYIAGDQYVAMEAGATPSGAYDIAKFVRGDHRLHRGFPLARRYIEVRDQTKVNLLADVPEGYISELAQKCLDEVVTLYREHPNWVYWFKQAHDSAWTASLKEGELAPPIDIKAVAGTIKENGPLLDYLADPYPEAAKG
jgi:hypothetical protein